MVIYSDTTLDRTFSALADPTRRILLAQLADAKTMSVSQLSAPLSMSMPAVLKHLDVLGEAGLVTRKKVGRTVQCSINADPMIAAMEWLERYQVFWTERLDRLAAIVESDFEKDME